MWFQFQLSAKAWGDVSCLTHWNGTAGPFSSCLIARIGLPTLSCLQVTSLCQRGIQVEVFVHFTAQHPSGPHFLCSNSSEPCFNRCSFTSIPPSSSFPSLERWSETSPWSVTCTHAHTHTSHVLKINSYCHQRVWRLKGFNFFYVFFLLELRLLWLIPQEIPQNAFSCEIKLYGSLFDLCLCNHRHMLTRRFLKGKALFFRADGGRTFCFIF